MALSYGAATALTWTPASVATGVYDASLAVDNSVNLYEDIIVGGFITTGTTPTTARRIQIFLYASWDGVNYSAGLAGTDGDAPDAGETGNLIGPIWVMDTDATSNHQYEWGPVSIGAIIGCVPQKWGLCLLHDTAVALNATAGLHEAKYQGIKY
ncbi:MAG: hypothetical protein H0U18_17055 [Pyrinomonadaceae bacterium]|nr:hypothetical protein [Pyrinomonadaceae bacterium]